MNKHLLTLIAAVALLGTLPAVANTYYYPVSAPTGYSTYYQPIQGVPYQPVQPCSYGTEYAPCPTVNININHQTVTTNVYNVKQRNNYFRRHDYFGRCHGYRPRPARRVRTREVHEYNERHVYERETIRRPRRRFFP